MQSGRACPYVSAWLEDERIVEEDEMGGKQWSKLAERYGFDAWYEEASKRVNP